MELFVSEYPVLNWLAFIISLYLVNRTLNSLYTKYLERKHGCKPINAKVRNLLFGIPFYLKSFKMKKQGVMIDFSNNRFKELNAHTVDFAFAGQKFIQTIEPDNIKAMLATQFNDFGFGTRHGAFAPLLGDGIFTLEGDGWKHSRAMLRPQFAREQVSQVKALELHLQSFAKHVTLTRGNKFDIQSLFFKLTLDSSTEFLFGSTVGTLKEENISMTEVSEFGNKNKFEKAFDTSQITVSNRGMSQNLYWIINNKEFRENCDLVHQFADFYVQKALDANPQDLEKISEDKGYVFLYELVKETRNPQVLRDQLLNILLAGRDTTAGLLSFTFFELARRPDVWAKLKEEVYESFGSGDDINFEAMNFETLKKCQYLKSVLNEALRMYPSVPFNFRCATKNTTLPVGGGPDEKSPILVKKGENVVYFPYSMQRDPRYYGKDADYFRPERWLTGETKKLGWAYLPFNGGPRICLGQQFALTQASYVVARLCQTFPNIESFDDEYPPRKNTYLTMSHVNGVFIGLS
ncbi:cytochrome P450 52A12 [[Candida] railenensis]|uniref:Cytochrome P450 52A12 n=1 Tax=[Candida] railenensis TaxID=45579 RepID=A0A9P0QSB6_9ASCO|nr:cytochrome P450 52A12 [[Candida] railenensis]